MFSNFISKDITTLHQTEKVHHAEKAQQIIKSVFISLGKKKKSKAKTQLLLVHMELSILKEI